MARALKAEVAVDRSTVLSEAVAETARHLEIGPTELAAIIGISQSSASRLLSGEFFVKDGTPEWQLSALLVRLYRGLFSIVGNNDALAREWLRTGNRAFGERSPLVAIKSIVGLVAACDYIDAHRAPA
jgi:hypothetical protein